MQKADPDVGIRFFPCRYGTMPESSGLIGRTVLSLGKVQQLAFQQIATQRRDAVREDHAFDMVVFVLNDPRLQSVELLVVLDEVFVEITPS